MCFPPSDAEFKFDKLSGSAQRGGHFSLPPRFYCIFFFSPLQLQSHFRIRKRLMMVIAAAAAACHLRRPASERAGELARLFIPRPRTFCLFAQPHGAHIETQLEAISLSRLFIYVFCHGAHRPVDMM